MFQTNSWKINRWNKVQVMATEVADCANNLQALKLTLVNNSMDKRRFSILINNSLLIKQLLEIAYGDPNVETANENDFIGLTLMVWIEEKNGYLNITNIGELDEPTEIIA